MPSPASFRPLNFSSWHHCPPGCLCERVPPTAVSCSPTHIPHGWLSVRWAESCPSVLPQLQPSPKPWFSASVLSCLLRGGLILPRGCNHHLPGQAHQLLSASSHCLQDSNPHCQTMTSCHPQPRPPPTQARPPMQPLPPTLLVVLLLLLYFCHDTHSQAGFTSKNAQHPWTSLASHPQFLKPARGKHPLISATGPGHTVGFCHVPSLASWVSCWTRLPTLSHILFYAGVLICS